MLWTSRQVAVGNHISLFIAKQSHANHSVEMKQKSNLESRGALDASFPGSTQKYSSHHREQRERACKQKQGRSPTLGARCGVH